MKAQGLRRWLARALILVFALACLVTLREEVTRLALTPLLHAWPLILCAVLLSLGNYLLRILRWRVYLERLGHRLPFSFTTLSYTAGFAFTLSPAKVGELLRARYYEPHGVPVAEVGGIFLVERLMDLFAATVLAAAMVLDSTRQHALLWGVAGLVTLALALLAAMPSGRLAAAAGTSRGSLRALRPLLQTTGAGLAAAQRLLRPDILAFGFAVALLAWGLEGVGLGVLASAFPVPQLSLTTAVGIYSLSLLAGALSFLPGGLGGTEAVMSSLLAANGFALPEALLLTLVCRLVTLWLAVALGWAATWALRDPRGRLAVSWR